jgi:hypothetical protein
MTLDLWRGQQEGSGTLKTQEKQENEAAAKSFDKLTEMQQLNVTAD